MHLAVIGIVPNQLEAERLVVSLCNAGFDRNNISALMPDNNQTKDMGMENSTKAPEGAATGASAGAVVGGTLGLLAGIGTLAIPGLGAFIAAGPIMATLGGVAIGGSVGGIAGALIGLGFPEYEAKRYESRVREGSILLSVHTDSREEIKRAEQLFKAFGAHDIKCTLEERAAR